MTSSGRNQRLHDAIEGIRAGITAFFAKHKRILPHAFVFSADTAPVRVDPNFKLPQDESKADFLQAIRQAVKRLNAHAVLTVTETLATKVADDETPEAIEGIFLTLYERGATQGSIWIATIERPPGASPFLNPWNQSIYRAEETN